MLHLFVLGRRALVFFAAIAVLAPAGSRAQQQDTSIVRVEIPQNTEPPEPIDDRRYDAELIYFNDGTERVTLALKVELLQNTRLGEPRHVVSPAIAAAFKLSASSLDLQPGTNKSVRLTGAIPASARSAYPDVIARYGRAVGSNVGVNFELARFFMLRGPKPWDERVAITQVGLLEGTKEGEVTVYADLRNIGNVHVRPRGVIEIRAQGKLVERVTLDPGRPQPGAILPTCRGGCIRRLSAPWKIPKGLKGPIDLTAVIRNPDARSTASVPLPSDETAQATASIGFKTVAPASVVAEVTNTGAVTLSGYGVQFAAFSDEKTRVDLDSFAQVDLKPKKKREASWVPGPLPDGRYKLVADVHIGTNVIAQTEATLIVGDPDASKRVLAPIALILLLVVLTVILLLFLKRRREDEDEEKATG